MLIAFLIAFVCARGYTRMARIHGWGSASFGGVHTHHLVFGIVLALGAGGIQFAVSPDGVWMLVFAAMFGVGTALILDEFALLFYLKDVYWDHEGRKSIDAVVIATILGVLFLLHTTPFGTVDTTEKSTLALVTTAQIINMIFVLIAALKGKLTIAIVGVFIPLAAWIGALRLAEPSSIWARGYRGKQKQRAHKRYAEYERVWRPRKNALLDFIGGKPGKPLR